MNSPFRPVLGEIRRIGAAGFDYVDLTLEPPGAWPVAAAEIRAVLDETRLGVVGHTAFYLPIAPRSPRFAPARGRRSSRRWMCSPRWARAS